MKLFNSQDFINKIKLTVVAELLLCMLVVLLFNGCSSTGFFIQKPAKDNAMGECVVLLHGMGRTYRSMVAMQEALTTAGYHTVNLGYPSTKKDIETLAAEHFPPALQQCSQFSPAAIHFVTHSLGGIVTRQAIKDNRPEKLGRVVMLSPPNQGSAVVDSLKDRWYYSWLNGPAGQQLSTAVDSVPNTLGPVDYPVGIITGDRTAFFDKWLSAIIPGVDDGKVSVVRAKVEGMTDFLVVHESHPYIMKSGYVHAETVYFLAHGTFTTNKDTSKSKREIGD